PNYNNGCPDCGGEPGGYSPVLFSYRVNDRADLTGLYADVEASIDIVPNQAPAANDDVFYVDLNQSGQQRLDVLANDFSPTPLNRDLTVVGISTTSPNGNDTLSFAGDALYYTCDTTSPNDYSVTFDYTIEYGNSAQFPNGVQKIGHVTVYATRS